MPATTAHEIGWGWSHGASGGDGNVKKGPVTLERYFYMTCVFVIFGLLIGVCGADSVGTLEAAETLCAGLGAVESPSLELLPSVLTTSVPMSRY